MFLQTYHAYKSLLLFIIKDKIKSWPK